MSGKGGWQGSGGPPRDHHVQPLTGNTSRCCHNPGLISVFNYYQLAINRSRSFKYIVVDIPFESSSSIVLAGVSRPLLHRLSIESRFRPISQKSASIALHANGKSTLFSSHFLPLLIILNISFPSLPRPVLP